MISVLQKNTAKLIIKKANRFRRIDTYILIISHNQNNYKVFIREFLGCKKLMLSNIYKIGKNNEKSLQGQRLLVYIGFSAKYFALNFHCYLC